MVGHRMLKEGERADERAARSWRIGKVEELAPRMWWHPLGPVSLWHRCCRRVPPNVPGPCRLAVVQGAVSPWGTARARSGGMRTQGPGGKCGRRRRCFWHPHSCRLSIALPVARQAHRVPPANFSLAVVHKAHFVCGQTSPHRVRAAKPCSWPA